MTDNLISSLNNNSIPLTNSIINDITARYNNPTEHHNWIIIPITSLYSIFPTIHNLNTILWHLIYESNLSIFQPNDTTVAIKIR